MAVSTPPSGVSNAELIRWSFEQLNAHDLSGLRELWAADVVERADTAEVGRRVVPAVRAGEVDELARGERGLQALARLLVELAPAGLGDRGTFTQQMVHSPVPLRLPIPSDPG